MKADENPSEEEKNNWHNDPNNWIWGMFYYNPKDKRIFPPKKIKELGWTINFANPNSVFLCIILVLVVMIVSRSLK